MSKAKSKTSTTEPKAPEPKPEIIKKSCKYTFTREEIEEINKELLTQLENHEQLVVRKKKVTAELGIRVKTAETEVLDTRTKLRDGYEFRNMDVRVEKDFKAGVKKFIRVDNGELVDTETLSAFDRQATLPGTEPEEEKPFNPVVPGDVPPLEIVLWDAVGDLGVMALERRAGLWHFGADLTIGTRSGSKALSDAKPAFKERFDAVKQGGKFVLKWIKEVAPDAVDGFKGPIDAIVESQREVVE